MNLSKNKYTDRICMILMAFTLAVTLIFMNGESLGMVKAESDMQADEEKVFSDRDYEEGWSESQAIAIDLEQLDGLRLNGAYELDGNLYLVQKGTYVLSGSMENRQIIVKAKGAKLQLVLDGVSIQEDCQPAILVEKADKVFLTLADGSENQVTVGVMESVEENGTPDAAIFSEADLTVNGSGSLEVNTENSHGIKSKDDLVFTNGRITVKAGQTALLGKDSVRIAGGTFDLTSGEDGIKANNDQKEDKGYVLIQDGIFTISAGGDGIQAETDVTINGGDFEIAVGDETDLANAGRNEFGMGGFGGMDHNRDMSGEAGQFEMSGMRGGHGRSQMSQEGEMSGGEMPQMPEREMPQMPGGEKSQMPGGEMPQMPEGEMPQAPGGEMPQMPGGEMSQMPEGERPQMPEGEMPGGEMPQMPEGEMPGGEMPQMPEGERPQAPGGEMSQSTDEPALHGEEAAGNSASDTDTSKGIQAGRTVLITGGKLAITQSYEGIEGNQILISGGSVNVNSWDDGMNASGDMSELPLLCISGGTVNVTAAGDGLDSNGDLVIDGGEIIVNGPSDSGNGALDSGTESGGDLVVNGGTILALGSSGMAETFSQNSTQYSFLCSFETNYNEGDVISILDSQGQVIYSYTAEKSGNSVVFSSPLLKEGERYTITAGGQSKELEITGISNGTGFQMGRMFGRR